MFLKYGQIIMLHVVTDHKTEIFTECYHVHYAKIQSARLAKRLLDNKSFYGGILHVCYAPECESLEETRAKLQQRTKDVLNRLQGDPSKTHTEAHRTASNPQINRKRKNPAIEINEERLKNLDQDVVWEGIPKEIDPRIAESKVRKVWEPFKHFQLPVPKGVVYGPQLPGFEPVPSTSSEENVERVRPSLIPSQVMKTVKYVEKKIVFRKK